MKLFDTLDANWVRWIMTMLRICASRNVNSINIRSHTLISRKMTVKSTAEKIPARSLFLQLCILFAILCAPLSPASADEVPAECVALYTANGAVPNTESCVYLASTISIGLGNYYCRTFAADTIDDFCGDTQSEEWVDLTQVETNYKMEDAIGSNGAGFAHQFFCIADKSCTNYNAAGDQSWASGFVKHLFDRMITNADLPESLKIDCWDWMSDETCFKWKGYRAHSIELLDGFFTYCDLVRTNVDYDRWDANHNTFLRLGVTACLDQVMATDNLDYIDATSITGKAANLRELAQRACLIQNFIRSGGSVVGDPTIRDLLKPRNLVEVVVPNSLRIPAPEKGDYYDPYWNTVGNLKVSATDDAFFVRPGEQVALSVSRGAPGGSTIETVPADTVLFELMTNEAHATITPNGVLTINSVASPFSVTTRSSIILIVASIGNERGVAQLMIQDEDTDGDTLVDSYEDAAGFNKAIPDDLQLDSNNDGTSDLNQILKEVKTAAALNNAQVVDSVTGGNSVDEVDTDQPANDQPSQQPLDNNTSSGGSVSYWILVLLLLRLPFGNERSIRSSRSI